MKSIRVVLSVLLIMSLVLCACGGSAGTGGETASKAEATASVDKAAAESVAESAAESTAPAEESGAEKSDRPANDSSAAEPLEEPKAELPVEGEYTLFGVQNDGYLVAAAELEAASELKLAADGTGSMTMGEDTMEIKSWTEETGVVTITMTDDSTAMAEAHDGILELDIYGDESMFLYYAKAEADISSYKLMTAEELQAAYAETVPDTRVHALWERLDTGAGVHLQYDLHVDYQDADQTYDVHGKDGRYYSYRRTAVKDLVGEHVTLVLDDKVYSLDPKDKTGVIATTITFTVEDIMMMDSLYSDIRTYALRAECTEETREVEGVSYTVEVFPATEYTPEAAFYFDADGGLAYYLEGPPVIETTVELGESFYTVHAIDAAVDETLFDVSGYTVAE